MLNFYNHYRHQYLQTSATGVHAMTTRVMLSHKIYILEDANARVVVVGIPQWFRIHYWKAGGCHHYS